MTRHVPLLAAALLLGLATGAHAATGPRYTPRPLSNSNNVEPDPSCNIKGVLHDHIVYCFGNDAPRSAYAASPWRFRYRG
jgi:hypothetical protein